MKRKIRKIFNNFGIDIHRFNPEEDFIHQVVLAMKKVKIDVVFDIGANVGQFSSEIRNKGYNGKIVSFEPLTTARDRLVKIASTDTNWYVHERSAVGDFNGSIDINISKNSYSSSILPMLDLHLNAANDSQYIGTEKTPIIKLDSVAKNYLNEFSNCFIKIDTQGYESQVLDGASNILKRTKGILCELSLAPLYEGQDLWKDLIIRLEKKGFLLWSLERGFTDSQNGRALQIDGLFLKKDN